VFILPIGLPFWHSIAHRCGRYPRGGVSFKGPVAKGKTTGHISWMWHIIIRITSGSPIMPPPHQHPMAAWHHGAARGYPDNNVPHPGDMTSGFAFRNRPFERNPTTWVPTAPMRNAVSEWESYWQNEHWCQNRPTAEFMPKLSTEIKFCCSFLGLWIWLFAYLWSITCANPWIPPISSTEGSNLRQRMGIII
jgi:hypothetical protein